MCGMFPVLGGCYAVPANVEYGGVTVPAFDGGAADCRQPYRLTQDCSRYPGATRLIEIDGLKLRVAGSEDGDTVLVMPQHRRDEERASNERAAKRVENFLEAGGARLVGIRAAAMDDKVRGYYLEFDRPVYDRLKERTIEE